MRCIRIVIMGMDDVTISCDSDVRCFRIVVMGIDDVTISCDNE